VVPCAGGGDMSKERNFKKKGGAYHRPARCPRCSRHCPARHRRRRRRRRRGRCGRGGRRRCGRCGRRRRGRVGGGGGDGGWLIGRGSRCGLFWVTRPGPNGCGSLFYIFIT